MLIVDAGDALLASARVPPSVEDLNKAETILRGHAILGVDAAGLGEAEIAVGMERLARIARQTSQSLLCANLVGGGRRLPIAPRKLVQTGNVKVGVFAVLELPETDKLGQQALRAARLRTLDPAASARAQVAALRREGAEVIVMLAHLGIERTRQVAREAQGIHLAIVAHSRNRIAVPVREGSTLIVEPGFRGQELGHAQVRLGPGWSVQAPLTDDSQRHVLYEDTQQEIEAIRKQHRAHPTQPMAKGDVRLQRVQGLARQLRALAPPKGPHTLVARLLSLDESYTPHAAMESLIQKNRESWRAPPRPVGGPGAVVRPLLRHGPLRRVPTPR